MDKIPKGQPLVVLNIGTRILLKDVMDTYLRRLGEVKTYYASKMSTALESYQSHRPQIIFCEQSFPEGSALEFIRQVGGMPYSGDQYFVLATEESSPELLVLAAEVGIDELLVKPFSTDTIHQIVERYFDKKNVSETEWIKELRVARHAYVEKRFQEADLLFTGISRKHAQNVNVQLECANYFLERGEAAKAEKILEWVHERIGDQPRVLQLSGMALKKLGRYREAMEKFRAANVLSPLNTIRHLDLAETYIYLADETLLAALKCESENSVLILRKARYQLLRSDFVGTVTYLDAKRSFLTDAAKKEADGISALAKKFAGLK